MRTSKALTLWAHVELRERATKRARYDGTCKDATRAARHGPGEKTQQRPSTLGQFSYSTRFPRGPVNSLARKPPGASTLIPSRDRSPRHGRKRRLRRSAAQRRGSSSATGPTSISPAMPSTVPRPDQSRQRPLPWLLRRLALPYARQAADAS